MVGQIVPVTGQSAVDRERAQATAAAINDLDHQGGIEGHRITLLQCDSKGDASTEVACARTIVRSHAIATISDSVVAAPGAVQSVLSAAGIPRLGVVETGIPEYQASDNFPLDDGSILQLVAMLDVLIRRGETQISVVLPEAVAATGTGALLGLVARGRGATIVNDVVVPPSASDLDGYVVQAESNGAKGAVVALGAEQELQLAQAVDRLRPKLPMATSSGTFSSGQLRQLGWFAARSTFTSPFPGADDGRDFPGLRTAVASLRAGGLTDTATTMTQAAVSSWLTAQAFAEILRGARALPKSRAQTLVDVRTARSVSMSGIIRPWTPGAHFPAGMYGGLFSNVSNPYEYEVAFNGRSTSTSASRSFDVVSALRPRS